MCTTVQLLGKMLACAAESCFPTHSKARARSNHLTLCYCSKATVYRICGTVSSLSNCMGVPNLWHGARIGVHRVVCDPQC
jgi:hypothetical protein